MSVIKKGLFILGFLFSFYLSNGQQVPLNPISYRIFTPFVFNPAIAGSKDFFSVDLTAGFHGKSNSQIISGNTRLLKKVPGYVSSPKAIIFTNIGVGAAVFNDLNGLSRSAGISAAGSYHFALNKKALSFLSLGASAKGIYHHYDGDTDLSLPSKNFFFPDLDAGIYYYSTSIFAGLSATNILGKHEDSDTLNTYLIPVSRQYFLQAGYKFVVSRSLNIVLEPSVIINTDDSLSQKITDMIEPMLKVYAGNFCLGTYFNDFSKISFFFQYKYPGFYIGTFFELPKDSPFYKKSLTAEFALGINFSGNKSGFTMNSHW